MADEQRLHPRMQTRTAGRSGQRITGRLPDDLLDEQVQRFGIFGAVAAGLWTFGLLMETVVGPRFVGTTPQRWTVAIEVAAILVSLSAFLYVRYAGHCAQTKSDAGLWFMLLNAAAVAALNTRNLGQANFVDHLSWNTV